MPILPSIRPRILDETGLAWLDPARISATLFAPAYWLLLSPAPAPTANYACPLIRMAHAGYRVGTELADSVSEPTGAQSLGNTGQDRRQKLRDSEVTQKARELTEHGPRHELDQAARMFVSLRRKLPASLEPCVGQTPWPSSPGLAPSVAPPAPTVVDASFCQLFTRISGTLILRPKRAMVMHTDGTNELQYRIDGLKLSSVTADL